MHDEHSQRSEAGEDTIVETDAAERDESEPDPELGLAPGTTVDRFVVLGALGEGGVGRVYAAYDPKLDRRVALKLLKPSRTRDSASEVAWVRREAQALARIAHPNVVTVYDVGERDGQVYLALEHVTGETLRRWVARARPDWPAIVDACRAAARGLLAVHEAGLVHRDVKPDNIMRGDDGRVRVMDFGLARERSSEAREAELTAPPSGSSPLSSTLTRTGALAGTPAYMAPEQHLGQPFDARTDQFALCVSTWELLYGQRPFAGDNLVTLVTAVLEGQRRPPPSDSPVPAWLRRALERGLAVDPDQRYPSLAELIRALEGDPSRRRRGWLAAGLGVVALAGLGWALVPEPTPEPPSPCAEVERFAAVWDPQRSPAALAAAFEASGSPLAAASAERVAAQLDRWAAAWDQARLDSCEATHVRREQSEATLDLRMACLDRHRARVAAIVEALLEADAELVREAPAIVAKLEGVAGCSDPERLRAANPAPADPVVAERVAGLTLEVEALRGEADVGRIEGSLARARALAAEAEQLGEAPLRVDAGLLVARLEELELGPEPSLATTRAAYLLALEHGLADRAALAAVDLMWRTSMAAPDSVALPLWADHARALIRRVDPTGPLAARLRVNEGIVAWSSGRLDEALAHTRAGVELAEAALGPGAATVGDYRNNLAYMAWVHGDEAAAIAEYERVLAIWSATLGAEHPRLGVAELSLAQIALDQGRAADASARVDAVLARYDAAGEAEQINAASAWVTRAELDRDAGELARARAADERALAIATAVVGADHWRAAEARLGLAELDLLAGDLAPAQAGFAAAERAFASLGSHAHLHGAAAWGLAKIAAARGEADEARRWGEQARAALLRSGHRGRRGLAELDAWSAAQP